MKKWFYIITIIMFALGTVACGGKDKRTPVKNSGRGGRGTSTTTDTTRNTSTGKGTITTTQERIDVFVSVAGNPSEIIGYIDGSGAGVKFSGSAVVSGTGAYRTITSGSISISIIDDLAVQGKEQPVVISNFTFIEGSVDSSMGQDVINMKFYDREFGQLLVLRGDVPHSNNGNFTGTIAFENETDGVVTNGLVTLGDFSIPVCSFFECN
ncbi:MAG: hypothetical protein H6625_11405 [Bdellovibrionaceae bacterium]|nr:hypothetical protein [Pseudobdellovibrionaceae bacterium]